MSDHLEEQEMEAEAVSSKLDLLVSLYVTVTYNYTSCLCTSFKLIHAPIKLYI